ncbi:MAG: IgA Peptidase M64 [Bacteroidetes bacterium]|nr:IgA Peptidase M64 [Bacteroidota bacterium]
MRTILFFLLVAVISHSCVSQTDFEKYFTDQSLRIDFFFYGNADSEEIQLDKITKEPFWGGTKTSMISSLDYGEYKFELIDLKSDQVIFSKGFCTLFEEWQTTLEADTAYRKFKQSILFPVPNNPVKLKIYSRSWEGEFAELLTTEIQPTDYEASELKTYPFEKILDNGDPANKVDLAILAEGYTVEEMDKFVKDSKRMIDYLFSYEPYKSNKEKFNIWLVKSESEESGTDIPGKDIYKNTVLNSNFYTFGSERYLTTEDFFAVSSVAASVPYDDVCILVNSKKYGGGGIYNHYAITTVDHALSEEVFIHELGHSFAGLGDEYYNSSTAYNDFFNLEIEPWQPNLTTLVNFDSKWKSMVNDTVAIPTPREKGNEKVVGAYEGGGYVNKGMFSPYMDCRMKTNEAEGFCPVCQQSIFKMIEEKSK